MNTQMFGHFFVFDKNVCVKSVIKGIPSGIKCWQTQNPEFFHLIFIHNYLLTNNLNSF
jgi:hypothetical protein